MANAYDVVVIGAGIIGASTAHFLVKKGVQRVLLVERGGPAVGGNEKAAGLVGISMARTKFLALTISGASAGWPVSW